MAALIAYAVWELLKIALFSVSGGQIRIDYLSLFICAAVFGLLQIRKLAKLHPVIWIAAGAAAGIILKL